MERSEFLKCIAALGLTGLLADDIFGIENEPIFSEKNFKWGVATAAYQIEGAFDADGKGPSVWDTFTHKNGKIMNDDNGDISCDFYHLYKEDIKLISKLKVPNFRFSLSWPRIFPSGTGCINEKGVDFYKRVVEQCMSNGIEPWITLYHWDLPQALEDKGGWTNRDVINWFSEYVEFCTRQYGDQVKNWIVLNEPLSFTGVGYFLGIHAPGKRGMGNFLPAAHHAVLCNAEGGRIAKANVQNGHIGTSFSCSHIEPASQRPGDVKASTRYDILYNRMFVEPLIGMGYPVEGFPALKKIQKYFRDGDEQRMCFNYDFIGIQNYTREIIRNSTFMPYLGGKIVPASEREVPHTVKNWEVYPQGIYELIRRFSKYPNIKSIIVTENGAAFEDKLENGAIHDNERINYLKDYISQVLRARNEGCPVDGYFVWSLLDNFEWADGYNPRFGLIYIDYSTNRRILKDSAEWYSRFIASSEI